MTTTPFINERVVLTPAGVAAFPDLAEAPGVVVREQRYFRPGSHVVRCTVVRFTVAGKPKWAYCLSDELVSIEDDEPEPPKMTDEEIAAMNHHSHVDATELVTGKPVPLAIGDTVRNKHSKQTGKITGFIGDAAWVQSGAITRKVGKRFLERIGAIGEAGL